VKSCSPHPDSSFEDATYVDAGVFRALRIYKPNTPVLPNLRILTWNPNKYTEYDGHDLDLFLTSNLLEISLLLLPPPAMLVSLRQTCNRLRKLCMGFRYDHPDVTPSISDIVVHLPGLESFTSGVPLTDDAIVCLSMSHHLQMLDIVNDTADLLRVLAMNAPHPYFLTLVSLTTETHDLATITSLLMLCSLRNLRSLILKISLSQVNDVERLFVELVSSCSHDVLELIILSHPWQDRVEHRLLPASILKHLFVFNRLRNISLDLSFDLDDDVVEHMAAAWPRISCMDVHFFVTPGDHPKITLRSLISLVKHCRDLSDLTLVLNVSSHDLASLKRDIDGLQNCHFTFLALDDAWINDDVDPAHASSFLNTLFPKLMAVSVFSDRQRDVWNEINCRLQANVATQATASGDM
jgi:hypothetical protein